MTLDNVTLCLTIGRRPDNLKQTLESLLARLDFKHIIAINDFGDEETNKVFLEYCPSGELISLGYNLGHHKAIDLIYSKVTTDYIFHCEDDWFFDTTPDIQQSIHIIEHNPDITSICFRKIQDFPFSDDEKSKVKILSNDLKGYARLDYLHDQWHGYTFNPHIAKRQLWEQNKPFSQFNKERHLSRYLRRKGMYVLFLEQGNCRHIGFESIANPPKKSKFWRFLKALLNI